MPSWLLKILIELAMKVGIPFLVEHFKFVPANVWQIIKDIISHIDGAPDKERAVKEIRAQLQCNGIGCPPKTKRIK